MARVRVSIVIDAPPATVWEAIADVTRHVDWMHDAAAIRLTSRRRAGVGTVFECDTRVGPFTTVDRMEITEWKARRVMGVRHSGIVTGTGRFTLKRVRHGRTKFTWDERLVFPLKLGGPVTATAARPVLRWIWRRNLRSLKQLVEGADA